MEIVSKFDTLLSNAEVIDIISENQAKIESGHASGRPEEVTNFSPSVVCVQDKFLFLASGCANGDSRKGIF